MDINLLTTLLSAGVIASLITGIFSLVISISSNKKVKELEYMKQTFFFNQDRYNTLKNAYNEVTALKSIYDGIEHNPLDDDEEQFNRIFTQAFSAAIERCDWIGEHFEKNSINIGEEERKRIEDALENLSELKSSIHDKLISALVNPKATPGMEIREYITNVQELEKMYKKSIQKEIDSITKK